MLHKIRTERFEDHRGFFSETYNKRRLAELGIENDFVQDNHSLSLEPGTIRGLHFQAPPQAQGKLVRCLKGAVFDVAVDIRIGSPTFGEWEAHELTEKNGYQLYVPIGFAHGFMTLEPKSEVMYKCTDFYAPDSEVSLHWDSCSIDWPLGIPPIISKKDSDAKNLADLKSPFIFGVNS
jgi:dTDP-4-dehydrorhamnose 3,5-epimerase